MRSSFLGQSHTSTLENTGLQTARPVTTSTTFASRSSLVVYAGPPPRSRRGGGKPPPTANQPGQPKRPETGFFAETDPNGKQF
jgi:hypothetical protein